MPVVGQRKSSLTKESGSELSSPSKSPDHYQRSDTLRQPLTDNFDQLSQELNPSLRSPLPTDHVNDHHRMAGEVHYDRPKHTRHHHYRHSMAWGDKDKVVLLVDGKRFTFPPALLTKQPNTMLGR